MLQSRIEGAIFGDSLVWTIYIQMQQLVTSMNWSVRIVVSANTWSRPHNALYASHDGGCRIVPASRSAFPLERPGMPAREDGQIASSPYYANQGRTTLLCKRTLHHIDSKRCPDKG